MIKIDKEDKTITSKYLFFDIECSNCFGGLGKICEFGYVLADENLRVLRKEEFLINPGRGRDFRFYLTGRKHEKDLVLAHDYDEYYRSPEFDHYYDKIRDLLTDKDTVVVGYAIENDIGFLDYTCRRYDLQRIDYVGIDVQAIVKHFEEDDGFKSKQLIDVVKQLAELSEYVGLTEHLSCDDAYMAMLALKKMLQKHQMTLDEMIEAVPECRIEAIKFADEQAERRNGKRLKKAAMDSWNSLCEQSKDQEGPRYTTSSELKIDEGKHSKVIDGMKERGYVPFPGITGSSIFVVLDEGEKEKILSKLKRPYEGKIITFDEFLAGQW